MDTGIFVKHLSAAFCKISENFQTLERGPTLVWLFHLVIVSGLLSYNWLVVRSSVGGICLSAALISKLSF